MYGLIDGLGDPEKDLGELRRQWQKLEDDISLRLVVNKARREYCRL